MSTLSTRIERAFQTPAGMLELIAAAVIGACVVAVFAAVIINFAACGGRDGVKRERRSVVATGSMTLFFVGFYVLIGLRVGVVPVPSFGARVAMVVAGLAIVVLGCAVNIAGRFRLGRNWANHVTIYSDQQLVTSGVYAAVRHPLYASLIWMFYGASLVYASAAGALANSLVFLPFMYYRARQEEALLAREFPEYAAYRRRVGMFFYKPFPPRGGGRGVEV
jgi:protein-S-isoprenylcysteine O-methyltransferase Ste14